VAACAVEAEEEEEEEEEQQQEEKAGAEQEKPMLLPPQQHTAAGLNAAGERIEAQLEASPAADEQIGERKEQQQEEQQQHQHQHQRFVSTVWDTSLIPQHLITRAADIRFMPYSRDQGPDEVSTNPLDPPSRSRAFCAGARAGMGGHAASVGDGGLSRRTARGGA
jgi:hypothetical protein